MLLETAALCRNLSRNGKTSHECTYRPRDPAPRCAKRAPPPIAHAGGILATWTDLAPGRAIKMRTALATAARALAPGEPANFAAASVRMDCPSLSRLLQRPPATFGLTRQRMTSLCSELRYIL